MRTYTIFGVVVSFMVQLGACEITVLFVEYLLEELRAKFVANQELMAYTRLTANRDFSAWSTLSSHAKNSLRHEFFMGHCREISC